MVRAVGAREGDTRLCPWVVGWLCVAPSPSWWPVRGPCRRVGGAFLLSLHWSWTRPPFESFAYRMQQEAMIVVYDLAGYCRLGDGSDPPYQRPFLLNSA